MCGVIGYNWEDREKIKGMVSGMIHRGPDHQGFFVDNGVSLGHARLSIIDLSEKGQQPMTFASLVIVYNGEIYNFEELRRDLEKKGHTFKSRTDTEVVVHAYAEWGSDCLGKFNGMFAFCIYDRKRHEWFLARDRLGIKPLYYHFSNDRFIFSSDMRSLLHVAGREIDLGALNDYFTYRFTPGEQTLIKGVKRLKPAHFMYFKDGKLTERSYWKLGFSDNHLSLDENAGQVVSLLKTSIKRRLISDVPIGVFLSGGLDSSAIVALLADMGCAALDTFNVCFDGDETQDSKFAKIVAKEFGTRHHQIDVSVDAISLLSEVVDYLGEPIGDAAVIPTYLMSRETKKNVTVVLSGEGADELFAGYSKYHFLNMSRYLPPLPLPFKGGLLKRVFGLCDRDIVRKYHHFVCVFSPEERHQLIPEAGEGVFDPEPFFQEKNFLDNLLNFDMRTWLPNDLLHKVDAMTMAHSLEARVPFLDHELVEFAATIPASQKMTLWRNKIVYRQAIKRLLPGKIAGRRKQGFSIPLKKWLKGGLREYSLELAREVHIPFMNKKYAESIIDCADRDIFAQRKFWSLLFFIEWYKKLHA